jgi:hypothetical protein
VVVALLSRGVAFADTEIQRILASQFRPAVVAVSNNSK